MCQQIQILNYKLSFIKILIITPIQINNRERNKKNYNSNQLKSNHLYPHFCEQILNERG